MSPKKRNKQPDNRPENIEPEAKQKEVTQETIEVADSGHEQVGSVTNESKKEAVSSEVLDPEVLAEGEYEAELISTHGNTYLRRLMDENFIEYASYVIKERAIPDVDDGLKPVQRRILWSLYRMDDGKFHKVANVIGHTMQYHPHGDASIGDALVVLANKEFYIEKQGNFGNIYTGDKASAARYIECRLTPLAKEVLYNNDITEFLDSYDGRNKEPVTFPCKIPSLLMLGTEGIAVGMSTKILSHNFCELIDAQIKILNGEDFDIYPDFLQGGIMDVSEYDEGNGKITLRSKIERDGRKLIIREIPASTNTESLIASIEKAALKNKIKIASINDYTTDKVEIEITPMRGYDPEKAMKALYAYTDCSVSISVNLMVIKENRPCQMTVSEVLKRNTDKLLKYLKLELEIELGKLEDKFHEKTLEQIFIENRIYKRIEECETNELVFSEIRKGLEKFRKLLKRDITDQDIERLLGIPIRRISLFDINKNKKDLEDILKHIDQVHKHLKRLKSYAKKYLQAILDKYGNDYPRHTQIEAFEKIDMRAAALNNIKVGWDRKNGYIGTNVKSEDQITCNEFDHLLCIEKKGNYKIISLPDKIFVGRLFEFRKYDKTTEFGVIYREKKSGKYYGKRCTIAKFIKDKEYTLCPKGCVLELLTPRSDSIYEMTIEMKRGTKVDTVNLSELPQRSPKARGLLLSSRKVSKIKFIEYIDMTNQENLEGESFSKTPTDTDNPNTAALPQVKGTQAVEKKKDPKSSETKSTETKSKAPSKEKLAPDKSASSKDDDKEDPKPQKTQKSKSSEKESKKTTPPEKKVKAEGKGEKKTPPPESVDKGEDKDDWGITQPEFGF